MMTAAARSSEERYLKMKTYLIPVVDAGNHKRVLGQLLTREFLGNVLRVPSHSAEDYSASRCFAPEEPVEFTSVEFKVCWLYEDLPQQGGFSYRTRTREETMYLSTTASLSDLCKVNKFNPCGYEWPSEFEEKIAKLPTDFDNGKSF
jgi:hypothetical protein